MLVFFLQWLSLHWETLIMLLSEFPLTFCQTQNRMPCFIAYLTNILVRMIGMVFVIIVEMFHGKISLNCASAAAAASEFYEWVQVGNVYNPHCKSQAIPRLSP